MEIRLVEWSLKMEIGELLKKYRLMHAATKKAWAGNVLSPSFYARVEKGMNRISADDLINLLHANKISVIEFFEQLNPHDHLIISEDRALRLAANKAYYNGKRTDLLNLYNQIAKRDSPNKEEHLMLLNIYMAIIDDNYSSIDAATLEKMKNRIFAADVFDVDTLNLYCNCISFYNLDENLIISKRAVMQFRNNNSISIQKNILGIIINILIFCIKAKRYQEADFYVNSAEEITTTPEIYFYKTLLLFFKDLLQYREKSEEHYLDQCHDVIRNIALSGMIEYSNELKDFLTENK